ncbi:MAG: sulfatase-like hydrolase/transferase [Phycisphaerae bacterium]|nr:sulfatase-like hydrolase/transferase [Phycisphaerae bacterium]
MNTTRREFIKRCSLTAAAMALPGCAKVKAQAQQPNIIFIMSDDHASGAISCYGSKINKTPNIDKLAAEGMRFDAMTITNAICAPSRATLLTGKYNHKNGFLQNGYSFNGDQQTFPKLLQAAGYQMAIVGKWHLKSQPTGFDYYSVIPGHGKFFDCKFKETGRPWRDGVAGGEIVKGYLTDVITDKSINWLKGRDQSKPFCLMVHHKAPHEPHEPDARHADMYADIDIPEPDTLYDDWSTRLAAGSASGFSQIANCNYPEYEELVKKYPDAKERTKVMYQAYIKGYLQLVASLDDNIGRLLQYIDSSDLKDNTIVVYTSDNGFFLGNHGFYNKMWFYDQALYVPLIVRYPQEVKAGSVNNDMVQNIDFAPTFLDYAGVQIPADLQGRSMRALLGGQSDAKWRDKVYYHYYEGYDIPEQYGIRTKTHKLICYPNFKDELYWELFDLVKDPAELVNIYDQDQYAQIQKQLHADLVQLRQHYGDNNEVHGPKTKTSEVKNLAQGCPVQLKYPCSPKYPGGSENALTDGIINNVSPRWAFYYDKWMGFESTHLGATIDLKKMHNVKAIKTRFLDKADSWIFAPDAVRIYVSDDGEHYYEINVELNRQRTEGGLAYINIYQGSPIQAIRYVRVMARNIEVCPDWHPGAGQPAWMFIDEIIVE